MESPRPWKVLVLDDSVLTAQLLSKGLERAGFVPRIASSFEELSTTLHEWMPQVVLADVNMPGVTGDEVCRLLKRTYDTAHVPVVLCSTLSRDELEILARECQADGFVTKSDGLPRLADELRLLCEQLCW